MPRKLPWLKETPQKKAEPNLAGRSAKRQRIMASSDLDDLGTTAGTSILRRRAKARASRLQRLYAGTRADDPQVAHRRPRLRPSLRSKSMFAAENNHCYSSVDVS